MKLGITTEIKGSGAVAGLMQSISTARILNKLKQLFMCQMASHAINMQ